MDTLITAFDVEQLGILQRKRLYFSFFLLSSLCNGVTWVYSPVELTDPQPSVTMITGSRLTILTSKILKLHFHDRHRVSRPSQRAL